MILFDFDLRYVVLSLVSAMMRARLTDFFSFFFSLVVFFFSLVVFFRYALILPLRMNRRNPREG